MDPSTWDPVSWQVELTQGPQSCFFKEGGGEVREGKKRERRGGPLVDTEALQTFPVGGCSHVPCQYCSCEAWVCSLGQGLEPHSKTVPRARRTFPGLVGVIIRIARKRHPTQGGLETADV